MGLKSSDLYPAKKNDRARIVATYDYADTAGTLLFQVVRFDPKDFLQRRPDPNKAGSWVWNMKGVNRVLFHLSHVLTAKSKGQTIYIVEGEKDVEALVSLGECATCNPGGAGKWQAGYTESLTGAKIIIIPDRDEPGRKHAALVVRELTGKAESIQVVELPDRNGRKVKDAADWVSAGGTIEELQEIVKNAPAWNYEDKRSTTSPENGHKGGRPPFNADSATKDFLSGSGLVIRHHNGRWSKFDSSKGWLPTSEEALSATVLTWLASDDRWKRHAYSRSALEIVEQLKRFDLCGIPENIEMPCWLEQRNGSWIATPCRDSIAFRQPDGSFLVQDVAEVAQSIVDGTSYPDGRKADESFFSVQWVNYSFDMTAQCPRFQSYLDQALDDCEQTLALAFIGLALTAITKYEVFIYLYGRNGREGKSTLIDIMRALLGWPGSVSYVDVAQLKERFASAPLAESNINITGDAADVQHGDLRRVEGIFKDLVSGSNFECELKNQNKRVAKCKSRFIFAGNSLPEFCDRSDAIWERLRICNFPRSCPIDLRDPDLSRKIIESELSGILVLAIHGLADVFARSRLVDTDIGLALKKELRRIGDHESNFLEDVGYSKTGRLSDFVRTADVYSDYRTWSEANGYRPLGMNRLCNRVRDILRVEQGRVMDFDGKRVSAFLSVLKGPVST